MNWNLLLHVHPDTVCKNVCKIKLDSLDNAAMSLVLLWQANTTTYHHPISTMQRKFPSHYVLDKELVPCFPTVKPHSTTYKQCYEAWIRIQRQSIPCRVLASKLRDRCTIVQKASKRWQGGTCGRLYLTEIWTTCGQHASDWTCFFMGKAAFFVYKPRLVPGIFR